MKRREFIRNGIILFAAPAIIKIENLMRIAPLREITVVGNVIETPFDEFMEYMIKQIAIACDVPVDLLKKQYKSGIET